MGRATFDTMSEFGTKLPIRNVRFPTGRLRNRTSIATVLESRVRLEVNPPVAPGTMDEVSAYPLEPAVA